MLSSGFPPFTLLVGNFRRLALVQEGRRDKAGGKREEGLYSKLFNLFGLVGYFRRAALVSVENGL